MTLQSWRKLRFSYCFSSFRLIAEHTTDGQLNINCVDPLNRSALIAAIENENIELIRILLESDIKVNWDSNDHTRNLLSFQWNFQRQPKTAHRICRNNCIDLYWKISFFFLQVNDALLHAISEEYVEAVEMLLYHEETTHKPGDPYVWAK